MESLRVAGLRAVGRSVCRRGASPTSTSTPSTRCSTGRRGSRRWWPRPRPTASPPSASPTTATCTASCPSTRRARPTASPRCVGLRALHGPRRPARAHPTSGASSTTPAARATAARRPTTTSPSLAETNEGYKNLIQLSSRAFLEGYYRKPKVDWELLAEHSRGHHRHHRLPRRPRAPEPARRPLRRGRSRRPGASRRSSGATTSSSSSRTTASPSSTAPTRSWSTSPSASAPRCSPPTTATTPSPSDAEAHDALLCVQTGALISQTGDERFKFNGHGHYLQVGGRDAPPLRRAAESRATTRCGSPSGPTSRSSSASPSCPASRCPRASPTTPPTSSTSPWRAPASGGASSCPTPSSSASPTSSRSSTTWGSRPTSSSSGTSSATPATSASGSGPGRGSAAGCAVAYCLRITDLDPIRYDLLFERFLNPSRISMPDIDMDFDSRYRDEMIRYAAEMLRPRPRRPDRHLLHHQGPGQAVQRRGPGAGLRLPDRPAQVAKAMPPLVMGRDTPLYACLEKHEKYEDGYKMAAELRAHVRRRARRQAGRRRRQGPRGHAPPATASTPPPWSSPATRSPSTCRSSASPRPDQDPEEAPVVTQYEMGGVEELGLLKMDFLGLRNLDVITDALEHDQGRSAASTSTSTTSRSTTRATLALLCRGDSIGVFQLEGGPMRSLMRSLAPTSFDDVAALVALYRPGPMAANMHNDYADRKNGRKPVAYFHPDAEELLADTYGLMIYQEAVMRVAQKFAGYSLAEADSLRKAMGKKSREVMAKEKASVRRRAARPPATARRSAPSSSASSSSSPTTPSTSSHSYGYGLIAYQTAYLKAHYPVEYFAALLTSVKAQPREGGRLPGRVPGHGHPGARARRQPVAVRLRRRPPRRRRRGHPVRALGRAQRRRRASSSSSSPSATRAGPFRDFYDFCDRVDLQVLNKRTIESLIKAGAFDAVGHPRKGLLAVFEGDHRQDRRPPPRARHGRHDPLRRRRRRRRHGLTTTGPRSPTSSSTSATGSPSRRRCSASTCPTTRSWGPRRRCAARPTAPSPTPPRPRRGRSSPTAASSPSLNRKWTRAGDLMAVFTLEDLQAQMEVMVFPKTMSVDRPQAGRRRRRRREGPPRQARRPAQAHRHGRRGVRGHHRRRPAGADPGCPRPSPTSSSPGSRRSSPSTPASRRCSSTLGRQVVRLPDRSASTPAAGSSARCACCSGADCLL